MPVTTTLNEREISRRQLAFEINPRNRDYLFEFSNNELDFDLFAGETINQFTPIYIGSDEKAYKSNNTNQPAVGLAAISVLLDEKLNILKEGTIEWTGVSLIPGKEVFLSNNTNILTQSPTFNSGEIYQRIGIALTTDSYMLQLEDGIFVQ